MKAESMNTSTEQNINEAIDWLQQTGGKIQDFAVEQAPLYCREVVAWEFWFGITAAFAGIVFVAIGVWLIRKAMKMFDEVSDGLEAIPGVCGAIFVILGTIMAVRATPAAIKAAVAPRLVIVEHLRGLNK